MEKLEQYAEIIQSLDHAAIHNKAPLDERLQITVKGNLSVYYAPFDFINRDARLVIVGLTPGRQQAINALSAVRDALNSGATLQQAARIGKSFASFSGPMRRNLVSMLDYFDLHTRWGLSSTAAIFEKDNATAHFTSVLRYPVFKGTDNYDGTPAPLKHAFLREQLCHFLDEVRQLPDCLYVPLGKTAGEVLDLCVCDNLLRDAQVLAGMPHPSGANMERISYMLERKPAAQLSPKTNARSIDASRARLREKLASFAAG